jgi:hypothetical protein
VTRSGRRFEEVQGPRNIRIDEILPSVRPHVRLVQCGRVQDRLHTDHAPLHKRAIGD